ncbi:MAG: hypothetical protein R3D05_12680 [Dongiaceae bacterium]
MTAGLQPQPIQIRVEEVSQLFNTLDPFPFRSATSTAMREEYIVGWARELARQAALTIVVHLPLSETDSKAAGELGRAHARFFAYRADVIGRDLNELFRVGRIALLVGMAVLGLCLAASSLVSGWAGDSYLGRFIGESLVIVGWVANWRPIEIFLYDWWPLLRRRNLYRRLAAAQVVIKADKTTA